MIKKGISLALVSLLAVGTLVGCGGNTKDSGSSNTAAPANSAKESSGSGSSSSGGGFEEATIAIGHATSDSENSHYQQFSLKFKEIVEKETGGKVKVEIHPNGELGGEREMIEAVQLGTLDSTITSSGPLGNFASKSNAFDFPFLFKSREHAYKVLDGELGKEVGDQLEQATGIKLLAWGENGFRNITNSKHAVKKPEDLKGLKIRTMENKVHLASFKAFGADPTPMAFTELFTAMQQGVVDGEENPLSVIMPNKFYEVQKYITLSGHFYSPAPFLINKAKFDSFSPELQKVVTDASAQARDYMREFIDKKNQEYLQIAKDNGMEVITRDEFDYDAFFQASQPVYKEFEAEYGEFLNKIINTK